jgi:polar amino acid transport system substrate-binding protein
MKVKRAGGVLIAASLCAAAVAAFGSGLSTAATTTLKPVPSVEKLVPAAVKAKHTITIAEDASYAPDEFFGPDGHTVIGMDADLAKALAAVMGLKANVVNAVFGTIIPGLKSGKFDMGASSATDEKSREKVIDFVDYFLAGTSFFTKAQGGTSVSGLAQLCGKSVAVEGGTTELADATAQSRKCTAAGKPKVNILTFNTQTDANLALSSGRAQLSMADSPVAAYQVKQSNGRFKITGKAYGILPYGIMLPKNNGMAKAVKAALLALMKNGTYTHILQKWGVAAGALPANRVKINGATS